MWKQAVQNALDAWKKPRWRWAVLISALSDFIAFNPLFVLAPPLQWTLDGVTALLLFAALGFKWLMLPALVVEAVPAVAVFPTWIVAVAAMAAMEKSDEPAPSAPSN